MLFIDSFGIHFDFSFRLICSRCYMFSVLFHTSTFNTLIAENKIQKKKKHVVWTNFMQSVKNLVTFVKTVNLEFIFQLNASVLTWS